MSLLYLLGYTAVLCPNITSMASCNADGVIFLLYEGYTFKTREILCRNEQKNVCNGLKCIV